MVRKRDRRTRIRDLGRKRAPRRAAQPGWSAAEVIALTSTPRRTIANYVRQGLFIAPEFRGTATRYQRMHLIRLLAIRLMKRQGIVRLKHIAQRLQSMGDRDVEAWVLQQPLAEEVRRALELAPSAKPPPLQATTEAAVTAPTSAGQAHPMPVPPSQGAQPHGPQQWQHLPLLPGLGLVWRDDAGPLVERAVQHLRTQFAELIRNQA